MSTAMDEDRSARERDLFRAALHWITVARDADADRLREAAQHALDMADVPRPPRAYPPQAYQYP